ncbi:MAG: PDZ domain-containing protein [Flavobacteriaceae bacterium]|nr:PDZ domain-containing protein [Flavobacteriaceae bacterium]
MKKAVFAILITIFSISFVTAQETQSKEKNKQKFGLFFDDLTPDQKAFNEETTGVVINRVTKGLPGEVAGVQIGDIITQIDTISIKGLDHCAQVMNDFDITKGSATLKIIRNGVKMDLKIKFE